MTGDGKDAAARAGDDPAARAGAQGDAAPAAGRRAPLHLFEGFGIELEYMIVDTATLAVRPLTDRVLEAVAGAVVSEVECGELAWSNELVLHVVELKTNGPSSSLAPLPALFQRDVRRIDDLLAPHGARLMPSAMHPWMDPATETVLWPHEHSPVYERYHAIFDCRGHGWSNLQSMHVNLPFAGDDEFARLHDAIRVLLPILPALAASSPIVEGRMTDVDDNRLSFYRANSRRVPSVTGHVVPEPIRTRAEYEELVLGRIYRDMEALDPEGVLRFEFINARGAIARFDRDAIEIRVLDVQEHPGADLAIAAAVSAVLAALAEGRWADARRQRAADTVRLAAMLTEVGVHSDATRLEDADYLALFGLRAPCTAGELWRTLLDAVWPPGSEGARRWRGALDVILDEGSLARRLRRALGPEPSRAALHRTYRRLCDCLHEGVPFHA